MKKLRRALVMALVLAAQVLVGLAGLLWPAHPGHEQDGDGPKS